MIKRIAEAARTGLLAGLGVSSPNPSQWLPFGPEGSAGTIIPPPGASW